MAELIPQSDDVFIGWISREVVREEKSFSSNFYPQIPNLVSSSKDFHTRDNDQRNPRFT